LILTLLFIMPWAVRTRDSESSGCEQRCSYRETKSVSCRGRGPPALTTPQSQRTAPHPSVNTSTEYSLISLTGLYSISLGLSQR
jgi:hypothetical protein